MEREPLKCDRCGREIPTAAEGLDYARIAKILGGSLYCDDCLTPREKALKQMSGTSGTNLED